MSSSIAKGGIDNVRGLANAHLTSWTKRTGADGQGRPQFGANQLSSYPVPVLVTEPTYMQLQTAEREGAEVKAVITLGAHLTAGGAGIDKGDRVECDYDGLDGKTLEITHRSNPSKPGLEASVIFVKEVGATSA